MVLKIRRRKFRPSFKAGEIVVTRRLFRSGDSEYLLNGKLCRLRDIQDIFMGTGLGPESYAIIEQGRIGQILSSKPTDRRAIIEEAAGITKFKTRKRLAEARLEEAKQNLARVNDIFEEVTRQMNSLKRQASKAERYARLRDEMRGKLRLVLAGKFAQLRRESRGTGSHPERARGRAARENADCRRAGTGAGRRHAARLCHRDRRAQQSRAPVGDHARDRSRLLAPAHQRRALRRADPPRRIRRRRTDADAPAPGRASRRNANRTARCLEAAEGEVAAAQQQAATAQQEATAAAAALADIESRQESRRAAIMEAVAAASAVREQLTRAQEHITGLERELRRLNHEIESGRAQIDTFGDQRGQIAFEFESASERVTSPGARTSSRHAPRSPRSARPRPSRKRRLDTLRAEYATALGKKGSLEAVIAEHGYSTESVRRLFQSGALNSGFAPVGVLADFLEVEDRYEHVVEDFLRDELNYIVVKSWDAADEGMRLLRTDVDGRATFLVHPSDSQARFSFELDEAAHQAPPHAQQVRPLKQTIRVLNGFGKSLEVILPKLRDGYIVPDPAVARELALENPDAFFLSAIRRVFPQRHRDRRQAAQRGPAFHEARAARRAARARRDGAGARRRRSARRAILAREIADLTSLLERLEAEKREADKAALTTGHSLRQLESEVTRIARAGGAGGARGAARSARNGRPAKR